MAMVVKNNMSAINTLNTLNKNTNALKKSLEKVSSGMKINSAADDASGYAISERMRVQIRSLDQANQNAQNGGSMMKVAEGAVSSTVEILKTLKEKAVSAANDTNTDSDRATIQKELDQSIDQINDNANVTFNGQYLVDGSHNKKTDATTTHLTNQSLSTDTATNTNLTELKARNGDSLNIHSTDTVTISYVKDGKTVTSSMTVGTSATLDGVISSLTKGAVTVKSDSASSKIGLDGSKNQVYTPSGEKAITLSSKTAGLEGQIAGFTMYITDNQGNVNKSANAALDAFDESIRSVNESEDNSIVLQIGTKAAQSINVGLTDMKATALGLQGKDGNTISVGTQEKANAAINALDAAIQKALDQQTTIGAIESRLEYTQSNLTTASENVTSAESVIRDADMAKEMTEYTKNNVLLQAAQSMLSQANQSSSNVLSLLQ
ncbi:Flagellin protein FlaA [Anaerovibrio sp. JC8]|uniref:flagellin N-terminal helical domain-containing protein n=1 Tax=Anaerovibrio sp. JC8 TaxID=1240085 RepID=UPI000A0B1361|nr:flagellin [Anaerovibrio sp. JC8]ORU00586.1 Flagellin protein FlaA [Anaerovibrio sp. JC8]